MSTDCQSDLIVEDWLTVRVTREEKSTHSIEPTKQQQHCFQHKNLCYSHFYQSHPLTQQEWILLPVNNHDPGVIPLILLARSLGEQLHSTYFAAYELFVANQPKGTNSVSITTMLVIHTNRSALLPLAHLYSPIHETFIVGTAHYMIHYTYRPSSGSSEYTRILATTQEVSLRELQNDMI